MKLCRTCKYWGVYAGAVGYGACCNIEVAMHVNIGYDSGLKTSQDFGCPFHQEGLSTLSIYSLKDQRVSFWEFALARKELQATEEPCQPT